MEVYLLALALCGLSGLLPAAAQVNTEKMRALDVDGFQTTLGGDVALQSGNADLFELGARLRFDYRTGPHYAFLTSEVRYGEEDGKAFRDRSFGHLRYNYAPAPWLVGEAFTQLESNGFTRLQLRVLAGGGLRVRYVDTERVKVFQGTTPMYEHENLNRGGLGTHPAETSNVRWSNYVNVRVRLSETSYIRTTGYVQPRLDAFADVRILNETRLSVAITKRVSLQVRFDLYYDSRPPDNVEDLDVALRNGLSVSL
jgi:putative salt-induced outer membrane protein YdiY